MKLLFLIMASRWAFHRQVKACVDKQIRDIVKEIKNGASEMLDIPLSDTDNGQGIDSAISEEHGHGLALSFSHEHDMTWQMKILDLIAMRMLQRVTIMKQNGHVCLKLK